MKLAWLTDVHLNFLDADERKKFYQEITKSNGIMEGFHRKMKLIQRRAYGFRNFENYRVRVKVLCG